jgi:cytoskeleton protein RodZ
VGTFGERLRREREMRGVSLEEIAESTKIGTRLLRALEEEQFDLLPGGIFNKGFVRAYARYLGMDEDQAVADYLQAAGSQEPDIERFVEQSQRTENSYAQGVGSARRGFPWLPLFLLFLVVAAGFGGWQIYQQYTAEKEREQQQTSVPAVESAPPTASNAAGNPVSGSGVASTPAGGATTVASPPPASSSAGERATSAQFNGAPAGPSSSPQKTDQAAGSSAQSDLGPTFEVVVGTNDRAWVSIKADGKITVRGIITSDQRKTIRAKDEIVVWTGNAGATEVSFEGKPVPVEGGVNEPKVLVFKPDGLQPSPPPKPKPVTEPPPAQTAEPSPTPQ